MKWIRFLAVLFCLSGPAEAQLPTVSAFWNFAGYPGITSPVSRVTIQGMPPYPLLNYEYQIPTPQTFYPAIFPNITNGVLQTSVPVGTLLTVTFSGPFGRRSVTNFFPTYLTNNASSNNAGQFDVAGFQTYNNVLIGVFFSGTNFLYGGPTNLAGSDGIIISGTFPNYVVGAASAIATNDDQQAFTFANNLTGSNLTLLSSLIVSTNISASGLTITTGQTNAYLTDNELVGTGASDQFVSLTYAQVTNGVSAALTLLNGATSNALTATNGALLVTIAAGSNSIAGQLAATNTAILATIAAGSNSIANSISGTNAAILVTLAASSNAIASALAATNTALLTTIAASSNAIASALAATNTALLTTIAAGSNFIATALVATNTALIARVTAATNNIAANSLTGVIAVANLPAATGSTLGVVRPDNATITVENGVISSSGGGGGGGGGSVISVTGDGLLTGGTITTSGALTNVFASPLTFLGGPTSGGVGQVSYLPYSQITNGVTAAYQVFVNAASNSLLAQFVANDIGGSNYTTAVSNSLLSKLTANIAGATNVYGLTNQIVIVTNLNGTITVSNNSALFAYQLLSYAGGQFLFSAGNNSISGAHNVGLGESALASDISGSDNTAVGAQALNANTTGQNNTAFGDSVLQFNQTGSDNTGIGASALEDNVSGSFNIGIGFTALEQNQNGAENIAIGRGAQAFATGTNNIGILAGQR